MMYVISGDVNFDAVPTKICINSSRFLFLFFLKTLGLCMATLNITVQRLGGEVGRERVPVL